MDAKSYLFEVVVEKGDEGYFVYCPALQGCHSQGKTYEEAIDHIRDAIKLNLEDRIAGGEAVPSPQSISVTTLSVSP
ncbi:MAG: type II toxin-antitoxin system HicB family antitoxin [Elusimicrobia bacterium]|nr:type II toxin-antitoxin system HicB family antitoxin [Elusimicrobiota bacterium]